MDAILVLVSGIRPQLQQLRTSLSAVPHSAEYESTLAAARGLEDALVQDFDSASHRGRKRPSAETLQATVRSLKRSVR